MVMPYSDGGQAYFFNPVMRSQLDKSIQIIQLAIHHFAIFTRLNYNQQL